MKKSMGGGGKRSSREEEGQRGRKREDCKLIFKWEGILCAGGGREVPEGGIEGKR